MSLLWATASGIFRLPVKPMPMLDYAHEVKHPREMHEDYSHPDYAEHEKYQKILSSVKQHGIHTPVHVEDGVLTDGHHRMAAAYAAGLSHVPAVHVEGEVW